MRARKGSKFSVEHQICLSSYLFQPQFGAKQVGEHVELAAIPLEETFDIPRRC